MNLARERVGHQQTTQRPFGDLRANLIDLAAREFDGELIRGGSLHEVAELAMSWPAPSIRQGTCTLRFPSRSGTRSGIRLDDGVVG